jgi:hypothetical protein
MKLIVSAFSLLLLLSSCGQEKSEPLPAAQQGMQLATSALWKAELNWNQSLRYSDEEFMEMRGTIDFRDENGGFPTQIEAVSLVADMPQHGHGTGNIQPRAFPSTTDSARYRFENLYFTMTGSWRIRVMATVNGKADTWATTVEVGD